MTTTQRLKQLRGLVNQLRGGLEEPHEPTIKRKCHELYGRPISPRTWQRWKAESLTQGWSYADSVCLRFLALGRSGNSGEGKMRRYDRERLIQDIAAFISADEPETLLLPPSGILGSDLEQRLASTYGSCSPRQWRNRGVHRRKVYSARQAQQIFEKLAS